MNGWRIISVGAFLIGIALVFQGELVSALMVFTGAALMAHGARS